MSNILGLITVNGKEILEVDAIPSAGLGTAAPVGSMAMFEDGSNVGHVYIKSGAADTAWVEFDTPEGSDWATTGNTLTGGSPTTPTEFFGSVNDYDVISKRGNVELTRLVAAGLLVGLNASLGGRLQVGVAALGDEIFKQSSPNGGAGARVIHVTRQYKVQTTDATPTVLAAILVPASSRIQANLMVGGNQHGGAGGALGDGADYERTISAKRLAAGNALLRKVQTDFTSEDVPQMNVTVAVATTNVNLSVVGVASCNMAWSAHAQIMIFAD